MSLEKVLERLAHLTGAGSDAELARTLDVSRQSLSKWRSRGSVPYEKLQDFAEKHGHSLDYLLMGKEPESGELEIDDAKFREVWAILRSEDCTLRHLDGDLLLGQAIYIYNQFAHIADQKSRAKAMRGVVRLLNSLTLRTEAQNLRHYVSTHPEMPKEVIEEYEVRAQMLESQAIGEEREMQKAEDEGQQPQGLGHSVHQSITGSGNQVAGHDFQNQGDNKGSHGGDR